ncbi:hypothetical protein C8N37_103519 [Sphingobacterium faecium]|nr:hypothetical protein C8N37_103519 [Sphingobacterium faecium]
MYSRLKYVKLFFKLLGSKEKMIVNGTFAFSLQDAIYYFICFTDWSF